MGQQASTAAAQAPAANGSIEAGGAPSAANAPPARSCYSPFDTCNPDHHPEAVVRDRALTHPPTEAPASSVAVSGSGFFSSAMATMSSMMSSSTWDFSGTWTLTSISGDMDVFLQQLNESWTSRTYASMMSYGVGRSTQTITHQGNVMQVESNSLGEATTAVYQVGAGRQRVEVADGKAVFMDARWEDSGRTLVVEAFTDQNVELPRLKRSLEGAVLAEGSGGPTMVLSMTMPSSPTLFDGSEVIQYFQRTSVPVSETATSEPTAA